MNKEADRVKEILATVKPLVAEYYWLTNKPLGVTGEIAEYVAVVKLNLLLVPPQTEGHDAIRKTPNGDVRIQIKGRAFGEKLQTKPAAWKDEARCLVRHSRTGFIGQRDPRAGHYVGGLFRLGDEAPA